MAKFCTQCGAPMEGNKFCTQCGAPAPEVREGLPQEGAVSAASGVEEFAAPTQAMPVVGEATAPTQAMPEADLTGFDTTVAMPAVATAAFTPAPAPAPAAVSAPVPTLQEKRSGNGAKIGIVAAAAVLAVGVGVALAVLHPWAPDSTATGSSAAAEAESGSMGQDAGADNTQTVAPSSDQAAQSSGVASVAPSTEVNINVNVGDADEKESKDSSEKEDAKDDGYLIKDSDTRVLSRSELENMSSDDLSRAQNEIWARHGRKFKNQWLQSYFDSQSWYTGTIEPDDFNSVYKSTSTEDANAQLINEILSERRWDVNSAHPN